MQSSLLQVGPCFSKGSAQWRRKDYVPAALQNGHFSQDVCLLEVVVHIVEHLDSHLCDAIDGSLVHLQECLVSWENGRTMQRRNDGSSQGK